MTERVLSSTFWAITLVLLCWVWVSPPVGAWVMILVNLALIPIYVPELMANRRKRKRVS